MRIFIHNLDAFLGRSLVRELRKAEGGLHRVFGTAQTKEDLTKGDKAIKRVVSRDDPKKAKKMIETIQSCRLVVIDLFNCSAEDLHFAISALKVDSKAVPPESTGELEQECTVVLVSSVMVWAGLEAGSIVSEADYANRRPVPGSRYEQWREMEELVFSCFNREGSQVRAFVVAAGVLYGEGEELFGPLFKNAWLGRQGHAILDPGTNRIPTVHVRDLARLVRQVGVQGEELSVQERPYLLAVDAPPPPKAPTPEVPPPAPEAEAGEGGGEEEEEEEGAEEEEEEEEEGGDKDEEEGEEGEAEADGTPAGSQAEAGGEAAPEDSGPQLWDLKSCPSTQADLVQGIVDELSASYEVPVVGASEFPSFEDPEDQEQQAHLLEVLSLDLCMEPSPLMLTEEFVSQLEPAGMLYQGGLLANIRTVAEEFCKERELRAMRVLITGPPASGKTTLAEAVAEHFNIPHLHLRLDTDIGDTAAQLSSKVCRYRGYVLDASLAGHSEVEKLFTQEVEVRTEEDEGEGEDDGAEGEEEDGEERAEKAAPTARQINRDLCPEFVVVLQAPEALCRGRWIGREGSADHRFQEAAEHYTGANSDQNKSLSYFFQVDAGIGVFNLPIAGKSEEDMFESVRIYMERSGRPFNYLKSVEDVHTEMIKQLSEREDAIKEKALALESQKSDGTATAELAEASSRTDRLRIISEHEAAREQLQELPLREYLMRYMVPNLTEGLIEVCKVQPDNPVDYLASFVETRAMRKGEERR